MDFTFKEKYSAMSDKVIIDKIITRPYNEEAATYLLYNRYSPKFRKLCREIYDDLYWYEDCVDDLFCYLKGKDMDWGKLRSFEWRSKFSTWIGKTAYNRFIEIKPYLIGKIKKSISIDDPDNKPISGGRDGEEYERNQRKIILMEAVALLKDADQKFVILKTLQGYSSLDIAKLMDKKWKKDGIVRYNNLGQVVVPTPAYVDVRRQRAKEELKKIIGSID